MKKILSNLLIISFILTSVGFLMDGDVKEPCMSIRFTEYFAMTGMIFTAISLIYFSVTFILRKLQQTLS